MDATGGNTGDGSPVDGDGDGELALRRRLGIPDDAGRVLVFTESSHWDPDWLLTADGYYRLRVRRNLRQAVRALEAEPRRVYGVECVFFLRMFYEREPHLRDTVRRLVNEGRLRMMGSGVTSPDTLIASSENLLRDYLLGQEWLRAEGMDVEPRVAYFPDSFGHSPALPSLLRATGVDAAAICRIDGMYFLGCESELPGGFPRPGTSAERLLHAEHTVDFVWRGPDGAEILCHWCAFGYGQGELLAHGGATRVAGAPLAVPRRDERHVARRVRAYVARLAPLARTPYLLCPIGFDFSAPIPGLVGLLDRYNERRYQEDGTWVVNAGLDDFLALVGHHRHRLPTVALDPNPYFMGFLSSRPTLKRRFAELTATMVAAELAACRPGAALGPRAVADRLGRAWWTAAVADHHDFVTGTSPDRVARREQLPWLAEAGDAAAGVLAELDGQPPAPAAPTAPGGATTVTRAGTLVVVDTPALHVEIDEAAGATVVAAVTTDGRHLVAPGGRTGDLTACLDTGGLWRMGNEFAGGRLRPLDRASDRRVGVRVERAEDGRVSLVSWCALDGASVHRRLVVGEDAPELHLAVDSVLGDDRTLLVSAALAHGADTLVTDVPGGVATRPARRQFDPTFWGARTFAVAPRPDGGGTALCLGLPGAVALQRRDGSGAASLAVVAARNATRERAWGFVRLPGMPATGHDPGPHRLDLLLTAVAAPSDGHGGAAPVRGRMESGWRQANVAARAAAFAARCLALPGGGGSGSLGTDRADVVVTAAKAAHRGAGIVVRLTSTAPAGTTCRLAWPGTAIAAAALCDARERDLAPLAVGGGAVDVPLAGYLTSVRLVPVEVGDALG